MKNNKMIITLLLICVVGVVGLTIAYFTNTTTIENEFQTKAYATTYTETFESPDNWTPGTTTPKTLVATNTGNVDQAVRISLSESWTPDDTNATLTGWIHADGTKSTHTTENELATDVRAAVINFTNPSDWTKVGDYYYYKYKLAPSESTSSLIESVTFNALTKLDDTCVETPTATGVTITCNSSGENYDNATYTLTFTIETVQYDKYNDAWNLNNSVTIAPAKPMTVQQFLTSKTNAANAEYNATTKGNMFAMTHGEAPNQTTDYRYIGDEPNNYVKFNCDNDGTNCEIWRILGVFDVEDGQGHTEQRIKLVRGDIVDTRTYYGTGRNDWTADNATLKLFLNGDYYNGIADNGLKESARDMIGDAVYYLGAVSYNSGFGTTEKIYEEERGTTVCGACNGDISKLTWAGKVGLLYPSDEYMVYGNGVNATCYDNPTNCEEDDAKTGWIYNSNNILLQDDLQNYSIWLLSSLAGNSYYVLLATSILSVNVTADGDGVRPVVYLASSVEIFDGDGSEGNPYKLK